MARFARTLSTLLQSGIRLLPSLDIVKNIVDNSVLYDAIEAARDAIREGPAIAPPLKKSGLFPPLLVHMIAVGEKSGELEEMLFKTADTYEGEVDGTIATLTTSARARDDPVHGRSSCCSSCWRSCCRSSR